MPGVRTHGIPTAAGEPVYLVRNDQALKRHPAYREAKAGDPQAAVRLVSDMGSLLSAVFVSAGREGGKIQATTALRRELERRYGDEIREEFGIDPAALTASEARYLIGFRTADELRTRAATARRERVRRLLSKGIRLEEAQGSVNENDQTGPPSAGPCRSGVAFPSYAGMSPGFYFGSSCLVWVQTGAFG